MTNDHSDIKAPEDNVEVVDLFSAEVEDIMSAKGSEIDADLVSNDEQNDVSTKKEELSYLQEVTAVELTNMGFVLDMNSIKLSRSLLNKDASNQSHAIAMHQKNNENQFIIVCSQETLNNHRQVVTGLENKIERQGTCITTVLSSKPDIEDIIGEKSETLEKRNTSAGKNTAAKKKFRSIVERAIIRGAQDIDIRKNGKDSYFNFKIDGLMSERVKLDEKEVELMVNAMLQTEGENMTGSLEDRQIISKSIPMTVVPIIDGKEQRMQVRLRAQKVYAQGGYTLSSRLIKTGVDMDLPLEKIGLIDSQYAYLNELASLPNGIVLIVGPTGHGKTVTLKAFYEKMPAHWKLIVLEDPVEYIINHPNVIQQPVVEEQGLTIPKYIKASLRQFPNAIGIAEVRDGDVAQAMVNLALSGHLMVSTLHTHDTLSSLSRLNEIGISYSTMALKGLMSTIMSQRLLPKLCDSCKRPVKVNGETIHYKVSSDGCDKCGGRGVKGRVIAAEVLVFDGPVRSFIEHGQLTKIEPYIRSKGWQSMLDVALIKVKEGVVDPLHVSMLLGDSANSIDAEFSYADGQFQSAGVS